MSDEAGNTTTYQLDYLAALKALDTSNTLISEKFYNQTLNVDLLGDLTETTKASLKISNKTNNLDDTQASNRLTLNTTDISDGRFEAEVSITGLFNNVEKNTTFINIDNTAPVLSDVTAPTYVNTNSATITGSVIDAGIGVDSISVDGVNAQYEAAKDTFTFSATLGAADQSYPFTITATDIFNQSSNTTVTVLRDTTKPIVDILNGATNGWSNASSITVNGACSDAGSGISTVQANLFGTTINGNCSSGSYSADFTTAASGTFSIRATGTDAAGNTQTTTSANSVKIDKTAPVVEIRDGPTTGWSNASSITVNGACSDANSGISTVQANLFGTTLNGNCSGGSYSANFTTAATGIFSITATGTDAAGNTQTATSVNSVKIDKTAPIVEIRDGPTTGWSNASSITVNGACSDANSGISTVQANLFGTTLNGNCSGGSYSANFTTGATYAVRAAMHTRVSQPLKPIFLTQTLTATVSVTAIPLISTALWMAFTA